MNLCFLYLPNPLGSYNFIFNSIEDSIEASQEKVNVSVGLYIVSRYTYILHICHKNQWLIKYLKQCLGSFCCSFVNVITLKIPIYTCSPSSGSKSLAKEANWVAVKRSPHCGPTSSHALPESMTLIHNSK